MSDLTKKSKIRMAGLRITPSILISVLALVVAVSSSATAAHVVMSQNVKKNAVASKHIKKKAVKAKHIAPRAVRPKHITPGAVGQGQLSRDVRQLLTKSGNPGAQGPQGEQGEKGATGPQGLQGTTGTQGAAGTNGVSGLQHVSASTLVQGFAYGKALAVCPTNKRAIGGGGHWQYSNNNDPVIQNNSITNSAPRFAIFIPVGASGAWSDVAPSGANIGNSWVVTGRNGDDNDERHLVAWVICASAN